MRNQTTKLNTAPRARIQQAWELVPRQNGWLIPPAPIGTRFVPVLPTAAWPKVAADDGLVSFTLSAGL